MIRLGAGNIVNEVGLPASYVLETQASESLDLILEKILPAAEMSLVEYGITPKTFSPDEFEAKYKGELQYDPHITETQAEYLLHRKKRKSANEFILSHGRGGMLEYVGRFGVSAAMSVFDPLTMSLFALPIPGSTIAGKIAGNLGKSIYQGAMGNALATLLEEPIKRRNAHLKKEHRDINAFFEELGYSAGLGATFGAGTHLLGNAASKLMDIYSNYKTNSIVIDSELKNAFKNVINDNTHPSGVKEIVTPLEAITQKRLELLEKQNTNFPEYSEIERQYYELETRLHQEYYTESDANIPSKELSILHSSREVLKKYSEALKTNEQFIELTEQKELLASHTIDTVKHIQHKNNAYDLSSEDLHIAREQLSDGKTIDLVDAKSAKSIYESGYEPSVDTQIQNINDELNNYIQVAHGEKRINLKNPEERLSALESMRMHKNSEFVKSHKSTKVGFNELFHQMELRQKTLSSKYVCDFYSDLEKHGLVVHFKSLSNGLLTKRNKPLERSVILELSNITTKNAKVGFTGSPIAANLASIIHKHQSRAVSYANSLGCEINELSGYITRQSHSSTAVSASGFEAWRDFILPLLDLERTNVDLHQVYLNLRDGHIDDVISLSRGINIADRLASERKLHFKSPDAFIAYNDKFGELNFASSVVSSLESIAKSSATIETLGVNPKNHLEHLKVDVFKYLQNFESRRPEREYITSGKVDSILEHNSGIRPENKYVADIMRNARSVVAMANLGRVMLASIPDIAVSAQVLVNNNIGLFKSYSSLLINAFKSATKSEHKKLARMLGIMSDNMLGSIYDRLHFETPASGAITKMSNAYYKLNLMEYWDTSFKSSISAVLSNNLAELSHLSWKVLGKDLKTNLVRYGITHENWGNVKGLLSDVNGNKYVIPNDTLVGNSIRKYLRDQVETGILTSSSRDKLAMLGGTKQGSVIGEAVRCFMQFKSYPLLVVRKALHSTSIGKIPVRERSGSFRRDLLTSIEYGGTITGLSTLFIAMSLLGYVSYVAKSKARGVKVPDFEKNKREVIISSILQGGGLGIFGDVIFKDYDRYKSVAGGISAFGPLPGTVLAPPAIILSKVIKGEIDEISAIKALNEYKRLIPGQNLFYLEPAVKSLLEE